MMKANSNLSAHNFELIVGSASHVLPDGEKNDPDRLALVSTALETKTTGRITICTRKWH